MLIKNCFKKKLVVFYKTKLLRLRFYNKHNSKTKKILNFFNVFFLGFIKITLLRAFFSCRIELLIKNNFFIFKYLKSFITAKISKKKYFVNNFLKSQYRCRHCLLFKRFYFLAKSSKRRDKKRLRKFLKLNIVKNKR